MFLEKFIIFTIFVFILGCPKFLIGFPKTQFMEMPPKDHPLDLLIETSMKNLNEEHFRFWLNNLDRCGSGHFIDPYTVFVSCDLQRDKEGDAEADFCFIFQKIIDAYNQIPELRPYLRYFPISTKEISAWLFYESSRRAYREPPYFCLVHSPWHSRKYLEFRKWTAPKNFDITNLPVFYKKEQSSIPVLQKHMAATVSRKKSKVEKAIILNEEFKKQDGLYYDGFLYPIVKKLCLKHNLHISTLSRCALDGYLYYRELCSAFWIQNKKIELPEAIAFSREILKEFLFNVRKKKVMERNFYKENSILEKVKKNLDWFCFRITFWDEYLNRVEEPYIAQIQCQDGKLLYYTADEGQRLQQVFEEPIPDEFFPKSDR